MSEAIIYGSASWGSWAAHTGYCNHNTRVVVTLPPRPPLACPCLPTPGCVWQSWYKLPWTTVFPSWREIKWELKAYTRFSVLNFALLIFSFSFFFHFCHVSVMVGFLHVVLWCGFSFSLVSLYISLSFSLCLPVLSAFRLTSLSHVIQILGEYSRKISSHGHTLAAANLSDPYPIAINCQ